MIRNIMERTRRDVLKMFGVLGLAAVFSRLDMITKPAPVARASSTTPVDNFLLSRNPHLLDAKYQIVDVPYEPGRGNIQSFPWIPSASSREGIEATATNEGGAMDRYDAVFEAIYGVKIRDLYTLSSREHLAMAHTANLAGAGEGGDVWAGFCLDAGSASFFAKPIYEGRNVLGVDFSKRELMQIATLNYAGLLREAVNPNDAEGLWNWIVNGRAVMVDWSQNPNQQWWGIARWIDEDNTVVITRHQRFTEEDGLHTERRHISQLRGAFILSDGVADPNYGSYDFLDKTVAGVILGNKKIVR